MGSILKKGLFLVTFSGAALALPATAQASDTAADPVMPSVGIEEVLSDCYSSGQEIDASDYLVPTEKGEYLDMAFADVDSFLYIRSEPTKQSAWVGKLYPDYAAKITGPVDEWTKIQSGSVEGYVYSDYIIIGNNAEQKAQEIIEEAREEDPEEKPEEAFTYAESKEEEEARLAKEAEEARRKADIFSMPCVWFFRNNARKGCRKSCQPRSLYVLSGKRTGCSAKIFLRICFAPRILKTDEYPEQTLVFF